MTDSNGASGTLQVCKGSCTGEIPIILSAVVLDCIPNSTSDLVLPDFLSGVALGLFRRSNECRPWHSGIDTSEAAGLSSHIDTMVAAAALTVDCDSEVSKAPALCLEDQSDIASSKDKNVASRGEKSFSNASTAGRHA